MPLAIPTILLEAVRNPVVAVGLPLTLGWASGFPTAKVVREPWYQVRDLHGKFELCADAS